MDTKESVSDASDTTSISTNHTVTGKNQKPSHKHVSASTSSKSYTAAAPKNASEPGQLASVAYSSDPPVGMSTSAVILFHAAKLLREKGYAAVSLRQIAAAANIKAGSIYYHFESKEEILYHVLEQGLRVIVEEINKAMEKLPSDTPFRERLKCVIEAHLYGLLQVGDFSSANIRIYGQVPPEVRRRHSVSRQKFADWWDAFLQEAVDEGALSKDLNLSVVRVFIVGALNWTVEWYDPERGSFDDLAEQIYSIVADGLVSD